MALETASSYHVAPISPADSHDLAKVMMTAMYQDPNWAILWGSMPLSEIISDCAERLPWNMVSHRATKRHLKIVHNITGAIVGYGRWVLPKSLGLEAWPEASIGQPSDADLKSYKARFDAVCDGGHMRGMDRRIANELFNDLYANEMSVKGSREYFGKIWSTLILEISRADQTEIDYMTVLPSNQRKGLAAMLVQAGNRAADRLQLPTYLMAMPQGIGLYAKHGFRTVRTVVKEKGTWTGDHDYVQTFMTREAQRGPDESYRS